MTIRILSPYFPFPPDEGNFLTVFDQICTLAERNTVEVISWLNTQPEIQERQQRTSMIRFPRNVHVRHLATATAARLPPRLRESKRLVMGLLQRMPSAETLYYPTWVQQQLQALPASELEIYHHTVAHPILRNPARAGTRRICMVHDLNSALYEQRAMAAKGGRRWFFNHNARRLRRHEWELRSLVDELWFVTPVELNHFRSFPGSAGLRLTSPTFNLEWSRQRRSDFDLKQTSKVPPVFGLIGDLRHVPNLKSLEFLVNEVCPLLLKSGFGGIIRVVGKGCPPGIIAQARGFPFLRVEGFVPDLSEFYHSLSLMLVPHVSGTGVRMKLLESLACGVPVLAHREAVARIHPELQASPLLVIEDSPGTWASILGTERPGSRRGQSIGSPIPTALDGRQMYAFVQDYRAKSIGQAKSLGDV